MPQAVLHEEKSPPGLKQEEQPSSADNTKSSGAEGESGNGEGKLKNGSSKDSDSKKSKVHIFILDDTHRNQIYFFHPRNHQEKKLKPLSSRWLSPL